MHLNLGLHLDFEFYLVLHYDLCASCSLLNVGPCWHHIRWPHGVTVSTLDSESSDRGSNPREAFRKCWQLQLQPHATFISGYSSVGRASDCRPLQQSDGPWFDSGWPDILIPQSGDRRLVCLNFVVCLWGIACLGCLGCFGCVGSLRCPWCCDVFIAFML